MVGPMHIIGGGSELPPGGPEAVGRKAYNLARMAEAGLPVPPAFVLPTSWCRMLRDGKTDEAAVAEALGAGMAHLEEATGLGFGSARQPLLVSVRSGGAVSMPGMLDTVLDVGLNAAGVDGMVRLTGNPRLAWDSYRRLVQGYGEVVQGLPAMAFDELVTAALVDAEAENERDLDHRALRALAHAMLERFRLLAGKPFPVDRSRAAATPCLAPSWKARRATCCSWTAISSSRRPRSCACCAAARTSLRACTRSITKP